MARKEETPTIVENFAEFKELKNIDKATMISVLEESFRAIIRKEYGGKDENFDVIMNPDKGDVQIFQNLEVVPDGTVENPNTEISLSDARADGDPDVEIGEEHTREITMATFGRRAITNLRQTLQSKILELHNANIFNKYNQLVGEIVIGEVYQTWSKETLLLDDDKIELKLPRENIIPDEKFRKGEIIRAVVDRVENPNNIPKVYVSRTSNLFLQRLFEQEIPEIQDGLISIKAIARIPGVHSIVAVESYDDRVDPLGACIGVSGSRIQGVTRELNREKIDVITYTTNTSLLIQRALKNAQITSIRLDEENKKAEVFINAEEVGHAIGRNGNNIKLASMITGYDIDVYREMAAPGEEDIYLDEFKNEIEDWIIELIKKKGYPTAKSVLALDAKTLADEVDLEEETAEDVLRILREEFED